MNALIDKVKALVKVLRDIGLRDVKNFQLLVVEVILECILYTRCQIENVRNLVLVEQVLVLSHILRGCPNYTNIQLATITSIYSDTFSKSIQWNVTLFIAEIRRNLCSLERVYLCLVLEMANNKNAQTAVSSFAAAVHLKCSAIAYWYNCLGSNLKRRSQIT